MTKRVELGIKATAVCSEKLQHLLKDISRVWNNLMGFMSLASLTVGRGKGSRRPGTWVWSWRGWGQAGAHRGGGWEIGGVGIAFCLGL